MRLLSALAIAGLALTFVPLPAAAQPSKLPSGIVLTPTAAPSTLTLVDFDATNAGAVTTPCPISLKVQAHLKNAGTKAVPVSYDFRLGDGDATTPQTASIPAGGTVAAGTVVLTPKSAASPQATRKGNLTIEIHEGASPTVVLARMIKFTATCPVITITPGSLDVTTAAAVK